MAQLLAGAPVAKKLEERVKTLLAQMERPPRLSLWYNSSFPEVASYVRSKKAKAEKLLIPVEEVDIAGCQNASEALELFQKTLASDKPDGVMVERPLGLGIQPEDVYEMLPPELDVEGLHPYHLGKLLAGKPEIIPPTPAAVMEILDYYHIPLEGKRAVIVGRSLIVGRPLFLLLLARHCTPTLCHTRTKNLEEITRSAEILIVAVGSPHFLKGDWISPDCVVVDVGINYVEGKLVGDVDAETVGPKAAYLTPVPGGVGPVTSLFALFQFVQACTRRTASPHTLSR